MDNNSGDAIEIVGTPRGTHLDVVNAIVDSRLKPERVAMAQLIVRDLDDDVVKRLKKRAAESGRSAEEEHRQILRAALRPTSLGAHLAAIPDIGDDEDFERDAALPREVDL